MRNVLPLTNSVFPFYLKLINAKKMNLHLCDLDQSKFSPAAMRCEYVGRKKIGCFVVFIISSSGPEQRGSVEYNSLVY